MDRPSRGDLMFCCGYLIAGADTAKERGHTGAAKVLEGVAEWLQEEAERKNG